MSRLVLFTLTAVVSVVLIQFPAVAQNGTTPASPFENTRSVAEVQAILEKIQENALVPIRKLEEMRPPATEEVVQAHLNVYAKTVAEANLAAGDRILNVIGKIPAEIDRGYRMKLAGLKGMRQWKQATTPRDSTGKNEYAVQYDTLVEELDKEGKFPQIVNDERYEQFAWGIYKRMPTMTPEKFEEFKEEVKRWANMKPISSKPYRPLMLALDMAEAPALTENDPKFPEKVSAEMVAFAKSDACTASPADKADAVERLEGYCRRCVESELKLYGKTLEGKDFDWEAYRGKIVLVKFTASWCGPCRREIPGMMEAYQKYRAKGFDIVSISVFDTAPNMQRLVMQEKIPWTVISEDLTVKAKLPPQSVYYGVQVVPTMLLVGKDGKVIATKTQGLLLKQKLQELFGE